MRITREALPFAAALILTGAAAWLVHPLAALPSLVLLLFVLWFFRDPHRTPPTDTDVVISPADGKIIAAGDQRVSIFLNVFDVHVCRSPIGGRVERIERSPGRFLAAYRDDAAEHNERVAIRIVDGGRRLSFTLVAGLVARRIVCRVTTGESLAAGQRVGMIRFGSRVDVDLPAEGKPTVRLGQRVRAGETIIGRLPRRSAPAAEGPA
jgi:phosphatidylserine decarboxylase